jgi:hypothetical protein
MTDALEQCSSGSIILVFPGNKKSCYHKLIFLGTYKLSHHIFDNIEILGMGSPDEIIFYSENTQTFAEISSAHVRISNVTIISDCYDKNDIQEEFQEVT